MLNNDMILIPRETLFDLICDSNTLAALEIGGVDNWEWYGESIRDYVDTWKRENPCRWIGILPDDIDIETISKLEVEEHRTLSELIGDTIDFIDDKLG